MKSVTTAWQFRTAHPFHAMRAALDPVSPSPWIERDSDYKRDSIAGKVTDASAAQIYKYGIDFYIVNLKVVTDGDLAAETGTARERLLGEMLPRISARDVKATEPADGT